MRDLRTVNMSEGQKIESEEVMKRIGDIEFRNFGTFAQVALFDSAGDAVVTNGLMVVPNVDLTVTVEAGSCIQRTADGLGGSIILACQQIEDQDVTIDAATGAPRTDIIEAQIAAVEAKNDLSLTATVSSGTVVAITNEIIKRDIKYYLSVRNQTNTTTPTAATAGSYTGPALGASVDLSERYNIRVSYGEDGDYQTIDCRGATPAATTPAEIITAINTAVGAVMASPSGSAIVLTGPGVGVTSTFSLKPPTDSDLDATQIIFNLSIGNAYKHTYTGENAWFKVAEINMGAATIVITDAEILDLSEKDSWAAGSSNVLLRSKVFSSSFYSTGAGDVASNVAMGPLALGVNTIGSGNIALGSNCLTHNTTGSGNIALGSNVLRENTTGTTNIALGGSTLTNNTTGVGNIGIGLLNLTANTYGEYNISIGTGNLLANTTGSANIALGYSALQDNTTGTYSVAIGYESLANNTTGRDNIAIGKSALKTNTTGRENIACGMSALLYNTVGAFNTACGVSALTANTTATYNTACGYTALTANTTGNYNVACGAAALAGNTTGIQNTGLGGLAGNSITTGTNNTNLGYNAQPTAANANNQITLGNSSVTILRCQVTTITALSDARDKTNINSLVIGTELIKRLEPKTFQYDMRDWYEDKKSDGSKKSDIINMNLIAQDLIKIENEFNIQWMGLVDKSNPDRYEVGSGKLLMPMIVAMKDLISRIEILETKIEKLITTTE